MNGSMDRSSCEYFKVFHAADLIHEEHVRAGHPHIPPYPRGASLPPHTPAPPRDMAPCTRHCIWQASLAPILSWQRTPTRIQIPSPAAARADWYLCLPHHVPTSS